MASLCVALLLLAAPEAPPTAGAGPSRGQGGGGVSIRAHAFEMEGVGWRGELLVGLRSVARDGPTSVWTADAKTLRRLVGASARRLPDDELRSRPASGAGPRPGAGGSSTNYVASLDRVANGPVGKATAIAFAPKVDSITGGITADLSGRRVPAGVLADVAIEDTQVVAMHSAVYSESVKALAPPSPFAWALYRLSGGYLGSAGGGARIAVPVQIPEVVRGSAAGRWRIPAGEVLVVGLGVHSVRDADLGGAVLRERVVVLDAGDVPASAFERPARAPRPTTSLASTLAAPGLLGVLGIGLVAAWALRRISRRSRAAAA